jgi:hypothetical protein
VTTAESNRPSASVVAVRHILEARTRGEIDVQYVGTIRAPRSVKARKVRSEYRRHADPLVPGVSIGHFNVTCGTLGAFVYDEDGYVYVLSNAHVLADTNLGKRDDDILQPGKADGGSDDDVVAYLQGGSQRHPKLSSSRPNQIDAAIARLTDDRDYEPKRYATKRLRGACAEGSVRPGDAVWKVGRTTGMTSGIVRAIELDDVNVDYDGTEYSFDGQLEIAGDGARSATAVTQVRSSSPAKTVRPLCCSPAPQGVSPMPTPYIRFSSTSASTLTGAPPPAIVRKGDEWLRSPRLAAPRMT